MSTTLHGPGLLMLFAGLDRLWIGGAGLLGRGACALGLGGLIYLELSNSVWDFANKVQTLLMQMPGPHVMADFLLDCRCCKPFATDIVRVYRRV